MIDFNCSKCELNPICAEKRNYIDTAKNIETVLRNSSCTSLLMNVDVKCRFFKRTVVTRTSYPDSYGDCDGLAR